MFKQFSLNRGAECDPRDAAGYSFFDSGDIDRLGRDQKRARNFVGEYLPLLSFVPLMAEKDSLHHITGKIIPMAEY